MMTKRDYDDNRNGLNPDEDELNCEQPTMMEIFLSFLAGFLGDVKKEEKSGN